MFVVDLNIAGLRKLLALPDVMKEEVEAAGKDLADQVHAHVLEQANDKLHTRREMFIEGLKVFPDGEDTWIISLDSSVRWIDDGMPQHSMVADLLKSPKAKIIESGPNRGEKYLSIPFQHNKGPTQLTPSQQNLLDTIKGELRKVGAPYGNLEIDGSGAPKLGLVRQMDIMTKPTKMREGPGTGAGPIGQVMQGPTGIPLLQGVKVYQNKVKNQDGSESVKKFIMTFRTVTSSHEGDGRWMFPGIDGVRILDDAAEWARKEWDEKVAPKLVTRIVLAVNKR